MVEFLKIVFLSVAGAMLYGVAHDQVTARICIEYFTVGHPPVFSTNDPTLIALGWGMLATWWVGLVMGVPLALAARAGSRPKLKASRLVLPLVCLLVATAIIAALAGIAGYFAAKAGLVTIVGDLASRVPADRHVRFIIDLWAHVAAYASAFLGTIHLCLWTWKKRGKLAES